MKKGIRT